jgi:hypothetical protein
MSVITTTKSGLKIEKCGNKYIATKGKQYQVYDTLAALSRDLATSAAGTKKPKHKKTKKSSKPKTHRPKGTPVKHRKTKTEAKRKSSKKPAGHKRGCKCVACSPATRKKAQAARKRGGKKKSKNGRQPSYTYGLGMEETPRRGRGRHPTPEVYHGDVGRFDRPRPAAAGHSYPRGYLPPGQG